MSLRFINQSVSLPNSFYYSWNIYNRGGDLSNLNVEFLNTAIDYDNSAKRSKLIEISDFYNYYENTAESRGIVFQFNNQNFCNVKSKLFTSLLQRDISFITTPKIKISYFDLLDNQHFEFYSLLPFGKRITEEDWNFSKHATKETYSIKQLFTLSKI